MSDRSDYEVRQAASVAADDAIARAAGAWCARLFQRKNCSNDWAGIFAS